MAIVLKKSHIPELLENLSRKYLVAKYQKSETVLSPKGYLLPPREKLFSYSLKQKESLIRQNQKRNYCFSV